MEILLGIVAFIVIINVLGWLGGRPARPMTEEQRKAAGYAAYTTIHNPHRHQHTHHGHGR